MQTPIIPSSQDPLSFEKIWFMFQESIRETKEMFRETDKKFQESEKRLQETERILKEKSLETEKMFQETKQILNEKFQQTSKEIDRLSKLYGGVSKNMGDAAEDYFYNGLSSTMQIGNIKYDVIEKNVRRKKQGEEGEFDDVLINSDSIVVMEVKYKLHLNQVEKLIQEQIPKFKKMFPEYKGYKIYGGVAGFAIPPESLNLATQNGLFVLTQQGEDMALLNGEGFKPKAW